MLRVTTNSREYRQTLRLYARARGKTHAEVVTRWGAQANFAMVRSEGRGGVPRAKIGKFPLNATANPERGSKTRKGRFYFALLTSQGARKGQGLLAAATKEYRRRRSARGAMAAGSLVSARRLGLKRRGGKTVQPVAGLTAAKSTGLKARPGRRMRASSTNAVKGSYEVGRKAMDRAIAFVLKDARQFALRLMQRDNDRARGRPHR